LPFLQYNTIKTFVARTMVDCWVESWRSGSRRAGRGDGWLKMPGAFLVDV